MQRFRLSWVMFYIWMFGVRFFTISVKPNAKPHGELRLVTTDFKHIRFEFFMTAIPHSRYIFGTRHDSKMRILLMVAHLDPRFSKDEIRLFSDHLYVKWSWLFFGDVQTVSRILVNIFLDQSGFDRSNVQSC